LRQLLEATERDQSTDLSIDIEDALAPIAAGLVARAG
jgi:hypothetical protein